MIGIANYVKAESLSQAYELNQKKGSVILGGMLWLKQERRRVNTAIDLTGLGLDTIEEGEEDYRIGAMVTLRQLELDEDLHRLTKGALRESLRHIVGVQFRNLATVGGSLAGRFGFSDVLTIFMAAGARVELYRQGTVSLEEYSLMPRDRDILVRVLLPKTPQRIAYLSQRNISTDFPVLTCAVSLTEKETRCCIGARPMRAVCFRDHGGILEEGVTLKSAERFAASVKETIVTGSNLRGSAEYRRNLAGVLTRRALLLAAGCGQEEKTD